MGENDHDGGYYAIKGFIYQFDITLLKIFDNPAIDIQFEYIQDINYENYVVQVKHKETQDYQPSKVRKPIKQLLHEFDVNPDKEYRLFCYFRNKDPQRVSLNLDTLNTILGPDAGTFKTLLKKEFVEHFCLEFSHDYETQFEAVVSRLKHEFNLASRDEAILYHSILHSHLFHLAIGNRGDRHVKRADLQGMVEKTETKVFYRSYAKYLSQEKYEKLILKNYFTINGVNINNFERLFVVSVDNEITKSETLMIVSAIQRKYFKRDKSPPPYICLRTTKAEFVRDVKRDLITIGTQFVDGTCFDGDLFRMDKLIRRQSLGDSFTVRFVDQKNLDPLLSNVVFHEVYQFFKDDVVSLQGDFRRVDIQIINTRQVIKMLGG